MKRNTLTTLLIITSLLFITCVADSDYTVPENLGEEETKNLQRY